MTIGLRGVTVLQLRFNSHKNRFSDSKTLLENTSIGRTKGMLHFLTINRTDYW